MTNVNLTANEQIVLRAFDLYDTVEATVSDLGTSWTGVKEIAAYTKLSVSSVKGILGSLTKKGLVQSDSDAGPLAVCLTAEGAREAHALLEARLVKPVVAAPVEAPVEEAPEVDRSAPVASTKTNTCAYLRARAVAWEGTRKEFIEAMVAEGINKATATTQWQRARGGKTE